ncbi:hypothetical protein [Massilia terrae]|uniref:Uncharacterized protein n=1 Tax=Massilia terrae TaxID=1811224 RepID=A0ABT2D0F5_9BURK|nr:hypothetical protein [Massilia terrae]MCS0659316.1 hypothetical protein [Massilia terrae]
MNTTTISAYRPHSAGTSTGLVRAFLAKVRRAFELAGAPYIDGALPL